MYVTEDVAYSFYNDLAYDGLTLRITDSTSGESLRLVLAKAFAEYIRTGLDPMIRMIVYTVSEESCQTITLRSAMVATMSPVPGYLWTQ